MPGFDFDCQASGLSLRNAGFLGQAAAISYQQSANCEQWARSHGLDQDFDFLDHEGTQGFVAQNSQIILVAFRGTQPDVPVDWLSDFKAGQIRWDDAAGRVHQGFYMALRAVWAQVSRRLLNPGARGIWITGHSLGGALANLCAAQAFLASHIPVQGVYTFGQPRVGTKEFSAALQAALGSRISRFINDRDIVPRVPLFGMGYRHCGSEIFYDHARQREERASAAENLAAALRLAVLALDLDPAREAGKLLAAAALKAAFSGDITAAVEALMKDRELAALGDPKAILARGTANVTDHDMQACYLARLGVSLPGPPGEASAATA